MVAEWGDCSTAASNGDGSTNSKSYNIRSVANHNIQDGTNSVPCYSSINKRICSDLNMIENSNSESTDVAKPVRCNNSPDICHLQARGHATGITSCLRQLAVEDGYHDMVLLCEGKKIVAHKLVLSAASSFLKVILENSSEVSPAVVIVEGVAWSVMQLLLQYIYLGEAVVPAPLLPEVVAAGEALGVTGLKDFRGFISPPTQTDPDDKRQGDCSSPSALRSMELHGSSTNVPNTNGTSSGTTGEDRLTRSCQSSPKAQHKKRRRRPSSPNLAEDSEAKTSRRSSHEKFNSEKCDISSVDSNEEIEVGSPPHMVPKLSATVAQVSDFGGGATTTTTTINGYTITIGGSSIRTDQPSPLLSSTSHDTSSAVPSSLHTAGPLVGPWHKESDNTVPPETCQVASDSSGLPTKLNRQEVAGRIGSSNSNSPNYFGSAGTELQRGLPHTVRDSLTQSGEVRGSVDACATLSALVESMRAAQTLSNGSGEVAARRHHDDDMVKVEASKKSSDFLKENILGIGSELPSANLFKLQHMSSGSSSPLAQLLNGGEKVAPQHGASFNQMMMMAGRAGTASNAGATINTGGGIQSSTATNSVSAGHYTTGHHTTEKMNGYSDENQRAGHDATRNTATSNDDHESKIFSDEIKAEFNKQCRDLSMDTREEFVSNSTSNTFNSRSVRFGGTETDSDYIQKLGNITSSALFKKENMSTFLSSFASNSRFDHLNFSYQNGDSANTRSDHSSNSREAAAASWDYGKNGAANDPPPVDEDVKRLLLQRPPPSGTAGAGPGDAGRGACPEPGARPSTDAEETPPQQHRFATQEEIDAALDVYQRKLAFHEPRPCPSCQRMYRDAATLRTHINIMHTPGAEPFVCTCGFLFRTKYEMYHHKKNGHYATSQPKL